MWYILTGRGISRHFGGICTCKYVSVHAVLTIQTSKARTDTYLCILVVDPLPLKCNVEALNGEKNLFLCFHVNLNRKAQKHACFHLNFHIVLKIPPPLHYIMGLYTRVITTITSPDVWYSPYPWQPKCTLAVTADSHPLL